MATPISSHANAGNSATSTAVSITLPTYTPTSGSYELILLLVGSTVSSTIPTPTQAGWFVIEAKFGTTPCAALFGKFLDSGGADSGATASLTLGTAGSWSAIAYIPTPGVPGVADVFNTHNGSVASLSAIFASVTPDYGTSQGAFGIEFVIGMPGSGQTDTLTVPAGYGNSATTATAKPTSVNTSAMVCSTTTATYPAVSSYTAPTVTQSVSVKYVTIFVSMTPPIPATPYAAYNFNEGAGLIANDDSGGGNTLTVRNTSASWTASGHTGAALDATASGPDATSTTFPGPASPGNFGCSFWLKCSGTPGDFDSPVLLLDSTLAKIIFRLRTRVDQSATSFDMSITTNTSSQLDSGIFTISYNVWHHFAMSYLPAPPNSNPFYLDAITVAFVNGTNNGLYGAGVSTNVLHLDDPAASSSFAVLLDDLRFYSVAITPANVLYDLLNSVLPPLVQPPPGRRKTIAPVRRRPAAQPIPVAAVVVTPTTVQQPAARRGRVAQVKRGRPDPAPFPAAAVVTPAPFVPQPPGRRRIVPSVRRHAQSPDPADTTPGTQLPPQPSRRRIVGLLTRRPISPQPVPAQQPGYHQQALPPQPATRRRIMPLLRRRVQAPDVAATTPGAPLPPQPARRRLALLPARRRIPSPDPADTTPGTVLPPQPAGRRATNRVIRRNTSPQPVPPQQPGYHQQALPPQPTARRNVLIRRRKMSGPDVAATIQPPQIVPQPATRRRFLTRIRSRATAPTVLVSAPVVTTQALPAQPTPTRPRFRLPRRTQSPQPPIAATAPVTTQALPPQPARGRRQIGRLPRRPPAPLIPPLAGQTDHTGQPRRRALAFLTRRRPGAPQPVPAQQPGYHQQQLPPQPAPRRRGLLTVRRQAPQVVPGQLSVTVPTPPRRRLPLLGRRRPTAPQVIPAPAVVTTQALPPQPAAQRRRFLVRRRPTAPSMLAGQLAQPAPTQPARRRLTMLRATRRAAPQPAPPSASAAAIPSGQTPKRRLPLLPARRGRPDTFRPPLAAPVPSQPVARRTPVLRRRQQAPAVLITQPKTAPAPPRQPVARRRFPFWPFKRRTQAAPRVDTTLGIRDVTIALTVACDPWAVTVGGPQFGVTAAAPADIYAVLVGTDRWTITSSQDGLALTASE